MATSNADTVYILPVDDFRTLVHYIVMGRTTDPQLLLDIYNQYPGVRAIMMQYSAGGRTDQDTVIQTLVNVAVELGLSADPDNADVYRDMDANEITYLALAGFPLTGVIDAVMPIHSQYLEGMTLPAWTALFNVGYSPCSRDRSNHTALSQLVAAVASNNLRVDPLDVQPFVASLQRALANPSQTPPQCLQELDVVATNSRLLADIEAQAGRYLTRDVLLAIGRIVNDRLNYEYRDE